MANHNNPYTPNHNHPNHRIQYKGTTRKARRNAATRGAGRKHMNSLNRPSPRSLDLGAMHISKSSTAWLKVLLGFGLLFGVVQPEVNIQEDQSRGLQWAEPSGVQAASMFGTASGSLSQNRDTTSSMRGQESDISQYPSIDVAKSGNSSAPRFMEQAHARSLKNASLMSRPGGGDVLAELSAGSPIVVGGSIRVPSGMRILQIYWVRVELSTGVRFGFLPADALALERGNVLDLDIRGLDHEALLRPAAGIEYSGGTEPNAFGVGEDGESQATSAHQYPGTDLSVYSVSDSRVVSGSSLDQDLSLNWLPETVARWSTLFLQAGRKHQVDPSLLAILTLVESGGHSEIRSPSGAIGLMQVMPGTGSDIARQRGIRDFRPEMLLDPATNVDFGAWYIARQLQAFGQSNDPDWQRSVELAASAYNGGPGTVMNLLAGTGGLPAETQRYRRWVGGMWAERDLAQSSTLRAWLNAGGQTLVSMAGQQALGR